MEIDKALEAVREIDRITKENPAVLLLIDKMKETGKVLPIMSDAFVSQKEAAKILGTNATYVCSLVAKGLLPCWILPGQTQRKYKLSDLHNFMQMQCRKGGKVNDNGRKGKNKETGGALADAS